MARLVFKPVTSSEWDDLAGLFGANGACGGCWCMWWRIARQKYNAQRGTANRRALKRLVDAGTVPGILAYEGTRAVGWCSVAPRDEFPALARSRVLARVDEAEVWSIVCFFIAKDCRRRGLTGKLIRAAVECARRNGAKIVEGYPVSPGPDGVPDAWAYTGLESAFAREGFTEAGTPLAAQGRVAAHRIPRAESRSIVRGALPS